MGLTPYGVGNLLHVLAKLIYRIRVLTQDMKGPTETKLSHLPVMGIENWPGSGVTLAKL